MNQGKKINRALFSLVWLILVEPLFIPALFPTLHIAIRILSYGIMVISILALFFTRKIKRPIVFVFVLYLYVFMRSLFANGDCLKYLGTIVSPLSMCIIVYLLCLYSPELFLISTKVLNIYIYINLITIIIFPNGMYLVKNMARLWENWFFGYNNYHVWFILPILSLDYLRSLYFKNRITKHNIILTVVSVVSLIKADSATGILGIVGFVSLTALVIISNIRIFSLKVWFFIGLGLSIIFAYLNRFDFFMFILEGIFKKAYTIFDRINIWNHSIDTIRNNMLFGIGSYKSEKMYSIIKASHAHNFYLQIMLLGGILLLFLAIWGIYMADIVISDCANTKAASCLIITIGLFFLMGIDENTLDAVLLLPMLMLALCSNKLDSYYSKNIDKNLKQKKMIKTII